MVTSLAPLAIFAGVAATVVLVFFSIWGSFNRRATAKVRGLSDRLDRAGIRMSAQDIVLTIAGCVVVVWIAILILLHPSLLMSLILGPVLAAAGALFFYTYLDFRMKRRLNAFIEQLELALRLIAGGIRVGLGLRQALTMVIDELPDPSKHEFRRVIGQTNLGISVYDAIDDMAERMPSNETLMLARVFRVQSQTGGDLSHILDQLAGTIKDRRQIQRKVSTLTAEGRMSAWVLTAIPLCLGLFIIVTQQDMGSALLFTNMGHIVIGIVLVLELLGYLWVRQLLKVNA
ncbi:MAG TPA: type II secretion system F family protein [Candidatus Tumulicola sp.]|jgi:tight adherence protein B